MSGADLQEMTQYLTFTLDNEVFALDIMQVREVMDFTAVARIPRTPDFVRGVINLRGSVVPVVDLRRKFGMSATEKTVKTCVIITEVMVDDETTIIGCLADSVRGVLDLDAGNIEPAPRIGTRLDSEFIKGMGKQSDGFVILLDIDRIFSMNELASLHPNQDEKGKDRVPVLTAGDTV